MTKTQYVKMTLHERWGRSVVVCPYVIKNGCTINPCVNCLGTNRDPMPWQEIFDMARVRK